MLWNIGPSPSTEDFSLKVGKTEFYIVAKMISTIVNSGLNWVKSGLLTYTTVRNRAIRTPWRLEPNSKVGIHPHEAWILLTV